MSHLVETMGSIVSASGFLCVGYQRGMPSAYCSWEHTQGIFQEGPHPGCYWKTCLVEFEQTKYDPAGSAKTAASVLGGSVTLAEKAAVFITQPRSCCTAGWVPASPLLRFGMPIVVYTKYRSGWVSFASCASFMVFHVVCRTVC